MYKAVLVDDEQISLEMLAAILKKHGVFQSLMQFTDPVAALEAIKSTNPHVVFTDIEMPQMNGLELAEHILEHSNACKIVFITAYDYYAIEAFELYAMDYVLKPFKVERLNKTIHRVLESLDKSKAKMEDKKLNIISFGKLEVFKEQKHVSWQGAKTEELFAFLLNNLGESVHKDAIIDIIWPEYDYKRALRNMQTAMSRVRQSLNELGSHANISYGCNRYKMILQNVFFDLYEFENLTKEIININDSNINKAVTALKLYQGDYLEQDGYLWSLGKQLDIKKHFHEILLKVIAYLMGNKKFEAARHLVKNIAIKNPEDYKVRTLLKKVGHNALNRRESIPTKVWNIPY